MEALSDSGNDRIKPGGNQPPAFDAHKANLDDLREEAKAWLDGKAITSPEEAEGLNTLLDIARKATKAADDARADEKKPHLDASKAVDTKWKPIITAGELIVECCKKALTPWNIAEANRKAAEAARARAEAEAEAEAMREAARAASGSLSDAEQLAQAEDAAKAAERIAKKAEKSASTGLGLRTVPRAEITDFKAAARFYWEPEHHRFEALVLEFAQRDARAGKRDIPGVTIHFDRKAF